MHHLCGILRATRCPEPAPGRHDRARHGATHISIEVVLDCHQQQNTNSVWSSNHEHRPGLGHITHTARCHENERILEDHLTPSDTSYTHRRIDTRPGSTVWILPNCLQPCNTKHTTHSHAQDQQAIPRDPRTTQHIAQATPLRCPSHCCSNCTDRWTSRIRCYHLSQPRTTFTLTARRDHVVPA